MPWSALWITIRWCPTRKRRAPSAHEIDERFSLVGRRYLTRVAVKSVNARGKLSRALSNCELGGQFLTPRLPSLGSISRNLAFAPLPSGWWEVGRTRFWEYYLTSDHA